MPETAPAGARVDEYSESFYGRMLAESQNSARQVVPVLLDFVSPRTVIDVGCGIGTWLTVFRELGVEQITGVDGTWVDESQLLIPREAFHAVDFEAVIDITGTYDVAISMEVAEHLPPAAGDRLVDLLTRLAPVVMFSAAVPEQGGVHHVNEQWPSYWVERFAQRRYVAVDCLRARLWDNPNVAPYYAQNVLIFVERARLVDYPRLAERVVAPPLAGPLDIVHPKLLTDMAARCQARERELAVVDRQRRALLAVTPGSVSLRTIVSRLPALIRHAWRRRMHRSAGTV